MSKRVFLVTVSKTLPVLADDELDAEKVALQHADEETSEWAIDGVEIVETLSDVTAANLHDCLPWGGDGLTTVDQIVWQAIMRGGS